MIEPTINDGPMPTSRMPGCSRFTWPGNQRDSLDEETTDWRAVCEKTARTVRRAGSVQADPDPYHIHQGFGYRWPCHIAPLRRMGPRLRGDDNGESLLHIFASGNPVCVCACRSGPRLRADE